MILPQVLPGPDSAFGQIDLSSIPLPIGIVDAAGSFLFLNEELEELIGTNCRGRLAWEVCRDDGQQPADCPLRESIDIDSTQTVESSDMLGGRTFRVSHTGTRYHGEDAVVQVYHEIAAVRSAKNPAPQQDQPDIQRLTPMQIMVAERSRISRDIHDELGATVTQIKLLGELLEAEADRPDKVKEHARLVSEKARQLADELDEIVWAVNPEKDHLENLAFYLGRHAEQFLEVADLRCRLDIPQELPDVPLRSSVRHRLFLAAKEALNNTVKHARATEVRLSLSLEAGCIAIEVRDDGCGISPAQGGRRGNGLNNMRTGLAEIGGTCEIDSIPGQGTRIRMAVGI